MLESVDERSHSNSYSTAVDVEHAITDDAVDHSHRSPSQCSSKCAQTVHDVSPDGSVVIVAVLDSLSNESDDDDAVMYCRVVLDVDSVSLSLPTSNLSRPSRPACCKLAAVPDDDDDTSYRC